MSGIFKKLFLTYLLVIIVSSAIIAIFTDFELRAYYKDMVAHELETSAILVEHNFAGILPAKQAPAIQKMALELGNKTKQRITIIDLNGKVLGDSESDPETMENHKTRPEIAAAYTGITGKSIRHSATLKIDMMYVAIPARARNKITAVIRVATPLSMINERIGRIHKIIGFSVLGGILAALIISFIIGRSFTNPIVSMKSVAEKISRRDFTSKVEPKGKNELSELGKSLNLMAGELQENISEIEREKNELLAVLAGMSDGVLVIGNNKRINLVNRSLSRMLYLRSEDVIGKYYWEAIGNDEINNLIEQTFRTEKPMRGDLVILLPEEHHLQMLTSTILDNNSRLFRIVCVFQDITQIKNLEKMRQEFVANASHELKTPITAIGGFVETLKDGAIDNKQEAEKFLDIIKSNADRMNELVNDMLTLSKSESKELKLELRKLNLEAVIGDVITLHKERALKKKQIVEMDIPKDFPGINADEEKIREIFSNLLDNAIKFTAEGGKISITGQQNRDSVKILIKDTGIGIPKEHIPRIFERFYRVDKARSREMGGTGLGLAIVKHLVQLHRGTVSVESQPNKGSTFTVELPKI